MPVAWTAPDFVSVQQFKDQLAGWGINWQDPQYQPVGNFGAPGTRTPAQQAALNEALRQILVSTATATGHTVTFPSGSPNAPPSGTTTTNPDPAVAKPSAVARQGYVTMLQGMGLWGPEIESVIDQFLLEPTLTVELFWSMVRETQVYADRFPANALALAGNGVVLDEADYIALETAYKGILRSAGLPAGFYDTADDFTNFISSNVSPAELSRRIEDGFNKVNSAPQEIKDFFAEMFGDSSTTALAAFFLDPDKSLSFIEEAASAAVIGGKAAQFGLDFDPNRALELVQLGISDAQATQAFGQVGQFAALFAETFGGESQDFTAEAEGVDTALGLDAVKLRDRLNQRVARGSGQTGAAISGTEGVIALG